MKNRILIALLLVLGFAATVQRAEAQITSRTYVDLPSTVPYVGGTSYAKGDIVTYLGSTYVSLSSSNEANAPSTSPTYWLALGNAGAVSSVTSTGSNCSTVTLSAGILNIPPCTFAITASQSIQSFGDSITCDFLASASANTLPYLYGDAGCSPATGYPAAIQGITGVPSQNWAISGDQACDIWPRQLIPLGATLPTLAASPLYTVMIGTNDARNQGSGPNEANYNTCYLALAANLLIPAEYKAGPSPSTITGGFAKGASSTLGSYASASSSGTNVYSITTFGGPIFLFHEISDSVTGVGNYAVDSGSTTTFNTHTTSTMMTQNSTSTSAGVEVITGVSAGAHTLTVNWVSGTIMVLGIATPPGNIYYQHPVLIAGQIPLPSTTGGVSGTITSSMTEYNNDLVADIAQLAGYGLDIRYAPNHAFVTGDPAQYTDALHPTALGIAAYAQAFMAKAQLAPIPILPVSFTPGTTSGSPTTVGSSSGTMTGSGGLGYAVVLSTSPLSAGSLTSVGTNFENAPDGVSTIKFLVLNYSGGEYSLADSFDVTPAASAGPQTFTAGTAYTPRTVSAGQFIGTYNTNAGALPGDIAAGGGTFAYLDALPTSTPATWTVSSGGASLPLTATVTSGGSVATTNVVPIPGMTPHGHCQSTATSSAAAANPLYVSAKASGQITVVNPSVSGLTYDISCTKF